MESSAQKSASKRERADGADLELVAQAKAGHLKAFEQLMSKYEGKVYSIAYRMTGNREDAEEVTRLKTQVEVGDDGSGWIRAKAWPRSHPSWCSRRV